MAKFCGNCGTQLDINVKVCSNCGTYVDNGTNNISGFRDINLRKQKNRKKIIIFCITIVIIMIAIVTIKNILHYTGYNGMVIKVMSAYKDYDINTLIYISSDVYYYAGENYVDNYFKENIGEDLDYFESIVGHNYKLSYKVNEIYELSDRRMDELLNNISIMYSDFDIDVIKKAVVAELIVTAKQKDKVADKNLKITMTKEGNSWKLLYIE